MYREGIPALGVSVEMGTSNVPDDGRYHVLRDGEIVGSYVTEAAARKEYQQIRDERRDETGFTTGWTAPTREELLKREQAESDVREVLIDSARSKRQSATRKGGKGGTGGVGG